ncbi:hypothetical protein [Corynebacterium wankanglinii]|uniref:Uncharacterized protein n=1 Tax=Corynebacterium wankanglinii TaxID=2735136 RepID=A0A838CKN6_9CORY|nr:hypothetical protein [Corynebacterium wankanglinii]MBA1835422.1 hypothetical protein [Corynebacterium wankanglinii]
MTTRGALVYDRRRPSGKRASVLALSSEQRAYRRANMTKPQMAQAEMRNSYEELGEALDNFQMFDATGHPEDWLPHTVEALDAFLTSLLGFQREVNAVVASDQYFIAVRERQNLEPIELNSSMTPAVILEDALRLSEGASSKAARVVKHMVHGLELREVN